MIILDTNVVSELMRRPLPDPAVIAWLDLQLDATVWITSITVLEVRTGIELLPEGRHRSTLSDDFERFLDIDIDNRVIVFDSDAARMTASLAAQRKLSGRPGGLRDSMIAGIPQATGAVLATRNTCPFADLSITLIDPWTA